MPEPRTSARLTWPKADNRDPENGFPSLEHDMAPGGSPADHEPQAAKLLKTMLKLNISQFHPDPMGAIRAGPTRCLISIAWPRSSANSAPPPTAAAIAEAQRIAAEIEALRTMAAKAPEGHPGHRRREKPGSSYRSE